MNRLPLILIAASLLVYSFVTAPVPALNEPHYLTKAKHFWNPAWCARDFFLDSSNAHTVFFATIGWLTTCCTLPVVAVVGRIAALFVLAWGWTALAQSLEDRSPASGKMPGFFAAWLFLALQTCGNWSGEWLVGGVESKVFAYGVLLWAWGQLPQGRWYRSALAMGLGTAFHPVVGLWGVMATAGALVWLRIGCGAHPKCAAQQAIVAAAIFIVAALLGVIPALRIVLESLDERTRYAATYIQVYYRLGHHLDPMQFPLRAYVGYGALTVVWLMLWKFGPRGPAWAWLHRITLFSLVFALAGLAAGWGPRPPQLMPGFGWRMHLLKFYPFRLADALLPIVVSLQIAELAKHWLHTVPSPPSAGERVRVRGRYYCFAATSTLAIGTLFIAHRGTDEWHFARGHAPDWIDACRWANEHTPKDALFITPHDQWSFKWYAERAEYVTFKDCPQDARGIVEWNRRQLLLTRWIQDGFADERYSAQELAALRKMTDADYLLADKLGPIDAAPVYQNVTHRVYDLRNE